MSGVDPPLLRARMKVWTDPVTAKRYLTPVGMMRSRDSDLVTVYIMSDEDTKIITLTADEWNVLPFFYFKEDGESPRGSPRDPDAVRL